MGGRCVRLRGCDLDLLASTPTIPPSGSEPVICFYSRPGTPRNSRRAGRCSRSNSSPNATPRYQIHLFRNSAAKRLRFSRQPTTACRTPEQLHNGPLQPLHRRVGAVGDEMRRWSPTRCSQRDASPIVNDAEHNRIVLDNAHIAYARRELLFELALSRCASSSSHGPQRASSLQRPPRRASRSSTVGGRRGRGCPEYRRERGLGRPCAPATAGKKSLELKTARVPGNPPDGAGASPNKRPVPLQQ